MRERCRSGSWRQSSGAFSTMQCAPPSPSPTYARPRPRPRPRSPRPPDTLRPCHVPCHAPAHVPGYSGSRRGHVVVTSLVVVLAVSRPNHVPVASLPAASPAPVLCSPRGRPCPLSTSCFLGPPHPPRSSRRFFIITSLFIVTSLFHRHVPFSSSRPFFIITSLFHYHVPFSSSRPFLITATLRTDQRVPFPTLPTPHLPA